MTEEEDDDDDDDDDENADNTSLSISPILSSCSYSMDGVRSILALLLLGGRCLAIAVLYKAFYRQLLYKFLHNLPTALVEIANIFLSFYFI
jgi:hypothetical protein